MLISCASPDVKNAGRLEKELAQELERLSARPYSEEGIATFLICENWDSAGNGAKAPDADGSRAALAATFRRYADTLMKIQGKVDEDDIAKLVEAMADRDFGASAVRRNAQ